MSASVAGALRDPARWPRFFALLCAALILWPLLRISGFDPLLLVDPQNLRTMGGFLSGFLPPETGAEFMGYLWRATLETLAIATAGIALAMLIAVPMAILTTRALCAAEIGPGPDLALARTLHYGLRALLTVLRGIPELVWALVFVRVFGLGPAAGVLAIALTYGGMLAKVYSEILESGDTRGAQAILTAGAGRVQALLYGLLPGSAQELTSYTVYRWECAVRASVVMGFVGAGGLGQLMDQAMKMLNGGEAATILATFLLLVLGADRLSAVLRQTLLTSGTHGKPAGIGAAGAVFGCLLVVVTAWSVWWLNLGLGELFTRDALRLISDFFISFFPPDVVGEWLSRVGYAVLETLAISAIGTLLAVAAGFVLALPSSGRYGAVPAAVVNFLFNALRSVPELVWATLMVLCVGLGPFAGVLALALHTTGVLGRLFSQALQNTAPAPRNALRDLGANPLVAFLYGTLPEVTPQLLAYSLYRWEMNIRMAAILGFVGAGGLGQLLYFNLSLFKYAQASTVIAAMLLLSIAVDAASAAWRRRL